MALPSAAAHPRAASTAADSASATIRAAISAETMLASALRPAARTCRGRPKAPRSFLRLWPPSPGTRLSLIHAASSASCCIRNSGVAKLRFRRNLSPCVSRASGIGHDVVDQHGAARRHHQRVGDPVEGAKHESEAIALVRQLGLLDLLAAKPFARGRALQVHAAEAQQREDVAGLEAIASA